MLWGVNVIGSVVIALVAADRIVDHALAQVSLPEEVPLPSSSQVYDRNGTLIATYRGEITRFIIDIDKLPDHVRQAVITAEDRAFYEHEGLSLPGLARAAWQNFSSGRVEQGGSTITQQYVKNAVLQDPRRTVDRKVKEAMLAVKVEERYTKDEILGLYMNTVYFGRGAYGIEAAARAYFAKNAPDLTLSEASYLAGLIPSPARWQPGEDGNEPALARRDYVLSGMRSEGYISTEQKERASSKKLRFKTTSDINRKRQPAAYFLEWLRKDYLYPHFGECLYTCGLKIHTTLDLDMQQAAEDSIKELLNSKEDPQAALVSMTPDGEVRAFVGGRHYRNIKKARGFNYASDGVRQAGSSFKPFTLLAALEEGISTSSTLSGSSPKTIDDPECAGPDGEWEPENYGGSSYGSMDLDQATANSVNTIYAELIAEIGPKKVADLLERFGFGDDIPAHCSLSLGTLDVSVLQMTRAYGALAARGQLPTVTPITYVETRSGDCLLGFGTPKKMDCEERVDVRPAEASDENSVDALNQALTGVVSNGTGTAANIGRPVAGKTGTTQDNRDAWFAGHVPQLTTVVWMGYPIEKGPDGEFGTLDDVSPLMKYCYDEGGRCRPVQGIEVTGGSFPAQIWHSFMSEALEGTEILSFPEPVDPPDEILNREPTTSSTTTTSAPTPEEDDKNSKPKPSKPEEPQEPTEPPDESPPPEEEEPPPEEESPPPEEEEPDPEPSP